MFSLEKLPLEIALDFITIVEDKKNNAPYFQTELPELITVVVSKDTSIITKIKSPEAIDDEDDTITMQDQ